MDQLAALIGLSVATALCFIAAITDFRTGKIRNWLTLPPIAVAPIAYWLWVGPAAALSSTLGIVGCGLVPFLLFKLRLPVKGERPKAGGGGDVKLMGAVGATAGLMAGLEVGIAALFAAGIYAIGRLIYEGKLLGTFRNVGIILTNPLLPKKSRRFIKRESMTRIRVGPAFLAGSLVVLGYRGLLYFDLVRIS